MAKPRQGVHESALTLSLLHYLAPVTVPGAGVKQWAGYLAELSCCLNGSRRAPPWRCFAPRCLPVPVFSAVEPNAGIEQHASNLQLLLKAYR